MIKKGSKVTLDYEGKFENGEIFDSSKHQGHHPLEFTVREKQVIPGFEKAVLGMKKDQEKEFSTEAKDAYGDYNPQLLNKVSKNAFPAGQELKVGNAFILGSPDGKRILARVTEIKKETVTIDLNHPLAGKKLFFKIKILKVDD